MNSSTKLCLSHHKAVGRAGGGENLHRPKPGLGKGKQGPRPWKTMAKTEFKSDIMKSVNLKTIFFKGHRANYFYKSPKILLQVNKLAVKFTKEWLMFASNTTES